LRRLASQSEYWNELNYKDNLHKLGRAERLRNVCNENKNTFLAFISRTFFYHKSINRSVSNSDIKTPPIFSSIIMYSFLLHAISSASPISRPWS